MLEWLWFLDRLCFMFINSTLSNPVGDLLWPIVTDYDKLLPVRIVLLGVWLLLLFRGGVRGRTAALMLIPVIICSDQLSSSIIKPLIHRARPCQLVDGRYVIENIHMLVDCGPGKAFPSSHAVNNFAVASVFAYNYRRHALWFYLWAAVIGVSRVAVGVHFPSDVIGGAAIGSAVGFGFCALWSVFSRKFLPSWSRPSSDTSDSPHQ